MADKSKPTLSGPAQERIAARESTDHIRLAVIFQVGSIVRVGTVCATFAIAAYFAYKSVECLAGQETSFRAILNSAIKWDLRGIATIVTALLGGGGWYRERRLRKREVGRLAARNAELERLLDPDRSSSGLTPAGESPKGDIV
jgi:hypothetical protein